MSPTFNICIALTCLFASATPIIRLVQAHIQGDHLAGFMWSVNLALTTPIIAINIVSAVRKLRDENKKP